MTLWLDQYKPSTLDQLDYHKEQANFLKRLVNNDNFPHLMIYGPCGAGKKTRIQCILKELYGEGVEKLRLEHKEVTTPSNKKIEFSVIVSNSHIEVNPSDVGIYDRLIIQDLIKNSASNFQLGLSNQKDFKVIVVHELDRLSFDAQHALRRTMEKYMASCRLILCAESTSRVIPAIRSRCLPIRVSSPSCRDIEKIILSVCTKENLQIPNLLANRIAQSSMGNLRQALLTLETCHANQYPFTDNQVIPAPEWKIFIKETATSIISEQSPSKLLEIRGRFYELLGHCIPGDIILKTLVDELEPLCDLPLKLQLYQLSARYDAQMRMGQKPIVHLESFVAKFMCLYKSFFDGVEFTDDW